MRPDFSRSATRYFPTNLHSYYDRRLFEVTKNSDILLWHKLANKWLVNRKSIGAVNTLDNSSKIILYGEILEAIAELENANLDPKALATEFGDMCFVIINIVFTYFTVDVNRVKQRVNGDGRKSNIFEYIREVAGNLKSGADRDAEFLCQLMLSAIAGAPIPIDMNQVFPLVVIKNEKNYPRGFYNGRNEDGTPMSPDEMENQEKHSRNAFRILRTMFTDLLNQARVAYGIEKNDWNKYSEFIADYSNSGSNLLGLIASLERDFRLSKPQTEKLLAKIK